MKDLVFLLGSIALVGWIFVAGIAWQLRNPKANQATFITHFYEAMTFQKDPNFQ